MELSKLASKPQLVEILIDDASITKKYGESLTFYIWDRQDIETFAKMAAIDPNDFASASGIVKDLILDEKGKPICQGENILPTDIMMKAVSQVVEELGKLVNTVSETETQS